MSPENVELVRRLFDTYNEGDYAAAAQERWDGAWDDMETVADTVRDGQCVRKLEVRDRSEALQAAGLGP